MGSQPLWFPAWTPVVHQPPELLVSFGPDLEIKERVRQSTEIVDLVGRYVNLRRQGRNWVGLCPFHDDRSPSLQVNAERQTWKCWVCDVGGDVFSFVMQREGVGFREALQMLAERIGIEIVADRQGRSSNTSNTAEKAVLYQALNWAAEQYHRHLTQSPSAANAREYAAERLIEPPTIDRFQLGFAPDDWSWLLDAAKTTSFTPQILEACGLVERKAETGSYYDRFRGRLMFPIRDTQQRTVAFGGRVLPNAVAAYEAKFNRSPAKYVNSPETKLFTKSDHLYGLDIARDAVAKQRQMVIVEGYTDVVLGWQAGVENLTAVLGTALNERHLRLIKRFADQVVLVLDGDEAGQRRTNEVLDLFVAAEIDLRVLTLPDGLDPCDFVLQRGLDPFLEAIAQAPDALDHKIDIATRGVDLVHEAHRASQALDTVLQSIAKAPKLQIRSLAASGLREHVLLGKLARKFHLPEETIRNRLGEIREQNVARPSRYYREDEQQVEPIRPLEKAEQHELELLEILLVASEKIDEIVENISPDQFVLGPVRDLYELVCHCYHTSIDVNFTTLLTIAEDAVAKAGLVTLMDRGSAKLDDRDVDIDQWLDDVIAVFNRLVQDSERRQMLVRMESQELSEEEEKDALARIFAMKQAEQQQKPYE